MGPSAGFSKRTGPGTAARLLAALEEAADDPEESYSERVTEKMRSMLGCIQEFLLDIGNRQGQVVNEPLVADARPSLAGRRGVAGGS